VDSCVVEAYLLEVLQGDGVPAAMAALDSIAARRPEVRRDGHEYAHAIGLAAYTGVEPVGEVFASCTPDYQSGCYHGVVQSYFRSHIERHGGELDPSFINELCRQQRGETGDRWLLFQCAHGMGHGLSMLVDYHLPSALAGCDLVDDSWERESCYGGVFMENIVHATMPHHGVGRPDDRAAASDHAHHDHGAADADAHAHHGAHATPAAPAAARPDFPPLRAEDPFYPCSALDGRYQSACWYMQTSVMLYFNGYDVGATAALCAQAPELFQSTCFLSLGRDVSSITGQDNARARRLCATSGRFEPLCHAGYAKNLVDRTADVNDGFDYCRILPPGEARRVCTVAMGEEIWVMTQTDEAREALCARAEPGYVEACRQGAGLPPLGAGIPASAGDPAGRG
jgi:hypothetical protein